jgi:hypothetical protein
LKFTVSKPHAAGQSHYDLDYPTHFGGATDTLCLPSDPELSNRTAPGGSYIYGTEYEQNFFTSGASNEDVPCAVCRASNTFASIICHSCHPCLLVEILDLNLRI